MTEAVLDASALLALLRDEPGAEMVSKVLTASTMTAVNLAEVVGHFARNGVAEGDIHLVLDPLPFSVTPFDSALAFRSGVTLPATRSAGLSLGDRACLALAHRLGVPVLTADRAWLAVAADVGVEVVVIR